MNPQNKFQCHYRLILQWEDNNIQKKAIVSDPVTINFNIKKSLFQTVNTASIKIYNLDASTREGIYQDRLLLNDVYKKSVTLLAGYGDSLTTCLFGHIQQCYSERVGVDMVTTIDVIDPDILTQYTSVTFEAGTTFKEAIDYLTSQFPNLKQGEIGNFQGEFKTPTVFDGNSLDTLNEMTGGHAFIDNGFLNVLNDNEMLQGTNAYLIQSDTGLLGTPKRYDAVLEIEMIFEPSIRMGQMVEIVSDTWGNNLEDQQKSFNGQYKVLGIEHNCVISGAIAGARTTKIQVQYANFISNSNVNLTSNPAGASSSIIVNNEVKPINSNIGSDINSIYKEILKNNGVAPHKQITQRISWYELINGNSKNIPNDIKKQITKDILANCKEIAVRLTTFTNTHFPGHKIIITSGYRTAQNNMNTEGSAKGSYHKQGSAIDFCIQGISTPLLHQKFQQYWSYGLGLYSWGLHVSLDPRERFRG